MAKKHFLLKEQTYVNLGAITRIDSIESLPDNTADVTFYGRGLDKRGVTMQVSLREAKDFIDAWKKAIK
jgi:hypothetical protein